MGWGGSIVGLSGSILVRGGNLGDTRGRLLFGLTNGESSRIGESLSWLSHAGSGSTLKDWLVGLRCCPLIGDLRWWAIGGNIFAACCGGAINGVSGKIPIWVR
jgi:hypothetical protein